LTAREEAGEAVDLVDPRSSVSSESKKGCEVTHVELSTEGGEFVVLEQFRQDFAHQLQFNLSSTAIPFRDGSDSLGLVPQ